MAIYFARHGQTRYGFEDKLEGVSNSILTSKGIAQAKRLGYFSRDKKIKNFFCSPLNRAKQTAYIASCLIIGSKMEIDSRLREMCYGKWDGKRKEYLKHLPEWREREENKWFFVHPGSRNGISGESYEMLFQRISYEVFSEIEKNFPQENRLYVAHNGVMRSARKFFDGLTPQEAIDYSPSHEEVIKLEKNREGKIRLEIIGY